MVELNHRDRTIKVKMVYYGPALGGKTTNLQILHQRAGPTRRGEMISVNSAQDRTILFDLLPLKTAPPGRRGVGRRHSRAPGSERQPGRPLVPTLGRRRGKG